MSTNEKLSVSWQFFETYGVISYGVVGAGKGVVNQCSEFVSKRAVGQTLPKTDDTCAARSLAAWPELKRGNPSSDD